jgi:hypothetical protein
MLRGPLGMLTSMNGDGDSERKCCRSSCQWSVVQIVPLSIPGRGRFWVGASDDLHPALPATGCRRQQNETKVGHEVDVECVEDRSMPAPGYFPRCRREFQPGLCPTRGPREHSRFVLSECDDYYVAKTSCLPRSAECQKWLLWASLQFVLNWRELREQCATSQRHPLAELTDKEVVARCLTSRRSWMVVNCSQDSGLEGREALAASGLFPACHDTVEAATMVSSRLTHKGVWVPSSRRQFVEVYMYLLNSGTCKGLFDVVLNGK